MAKSESERLAEAASKLPFSMPESNLPAAWTQSTQRFASAMAAVSAEMMKFASRRFEAQAKAWDACSKCTDIPTLTKMQGQFLTDMAADYTSEASELMRIAQDIATNGGPGQAK